MTHLPVTPLEAWTARRLSLDAGRRPTPEVLAAAQLAALQRIVAYARTHSPFYRRFLAGAPETIADTAAFARLPLTTADDLCRDPTAFICVSQAEVARVVTLETSGTTGAPKRVFFTAADLERTIDFFHHGMTTLVAAGQRVLILLPGPRPASVGDLLRQALARLDVEAIVHGPLIEPQDLMRRLASKPVHAIVGLPLQVLGLARGAAGPCPAPRNVLLTADHVPRVVVDALRHIWGCGVYQHYGMTEMGYGGAVECAAMDGYHLREADLFFEIVDPVSGRPLPPGRSGEVVITTLERAGMPLIRYRTGDTAHFRPDPCPCGSVLRRMAPVAGRCTGRLALGTAGHLALDDLDEAVLALCGVVGLDACIDRDQGTGDRLHVTVVTAGDDPPVDLAAVVRAALERVPVLARAMAQGHLVLAPIAIRPPSLNTAARMNKRRLVDRR